MNRVCIEISSGKLIEYQSGGYDENNEALTAARLNTLKQNAIAAGYTEDRIDVKWVTDEEAAAILEANKPVPTYAELRRAAYPDFREYLDGIVKGDQAQIDKYIADCLAVKAKYPKG